MKILGFAASNSRQSINGQLVRHAGDVLRAELGPDVDFQTIDLNDYEMPIYSVDREAETGIPQQAHEFLDAIADADAVVVSFAEHNGNVTAAFKNVLDWASRVTKIWQGKPLVLLSTSPGPGGARSVLGIMSGAAPFWDGDLRGTLSIPHFFDAFDVASGSLHGGEIADAFRDAVVAVGDAEHILTESAA